VPATITKPSSAITIGATSAAALLLVVMAIVAILSVLIGQSTCSGAQAEAVPSADAEQGIPMTYLTLYRRAGRRYGVPWQILAGIGSLETDHGRSRAPGVRAGVNSHGCCAGPMQFNTRDGPPSTWQRYGLDGNRDGTRDIYDPADAIPSGANYLRVLLRNADGNLSEAILGYNHSQAYINEVLARARVYTDLTDGELAAPGSASTGVTGCAGGGLDVPAGPANLHDAQRISSPRAFRILPSWALASGAGPGAVDARIYDDVVWILRRYHLRVTAARAAGHHTHGDGTAIDLTPADGITQATWDASAGRVAHDLGWTPSCGSSGSRPACPLVPAIQFIAYDGYPSHGSPRTCSRACPAHIHISWVSPCYGSSGLGPPCEWAMAFPVPDADDTSSTS
jgi:hypothetical protein